MNPTSLFYRAEKLIDELELNRHVPSSAQLTYFLASCYDSANPNASDIHSTYTSTSSNVKEDPSYLPFEPTLVILHSASSYLEEPVHQE